MAHSFEWKPEYDTGIKSIDDQHKKLVGYINQMEDALASEDPLTEAYAVATSLLGYTRAHFKFEEKLFELHGYPQEQQHKNLHNDLTGQVGEVMAKLRSREPGITEVLLPFLTDWLQNHILKEDMAYVPHLKSKGVV